MNLVYSVELQTYSFLYLATHEHFNSKRSEPEHLNVSTSQCPKTSENRLPPPFNTASPDPAGMA